MDRGRGRRQVCLPHAWGKRVLSSQRWFRQREAMLHWHGCHPLAPHAGLSVASVPVPSHPPLLCWCGHQTGQCALGGAPPGPLSMGPGRQGAGRLLSGTCVWLSHCVLSVRVTSVPRKSCFSHRGRQPQAGTSSPPSRARRLRGRCCHLCPPAGAAVTADRSPPGLPGQRAGPRR